MKQTSETTQDGRIVFTNSMAYKAGNKLDYEKLTTVIPNDGQTLKDVGDAFKRYGESKLAALYGARELAHRIRGLGMRHIYTNSCHPGAAIGTTLGDGHQKGVNETFGRLLRFTLAKTIGNTTIDSAKTQVYLASSKEIKDHDTNGEFWSPKWALITRSYQGCAAEEYTKLANDEHERKKLWDVTVDSFKKVVGEDEINSVELARNLIK